MLSQLQSTKKYFIIACLTSCILLEVFTLVIYDQSRANKDSNDWVIHSYEVLRLTRLALVDAIDMAHEEEAYILTGYPSHFAAYKEALSSLNARMGALSQAIADNPEQQKSAFILSDKVEALKRISASHIETLHSGHISVYSMKSNDETTRQAVNDIRTAFDYFSENEAQLLDQRAHFANSKHRSYLWTLFLGGVIGLGALIITNLIIFSLISKNSRSEEHLRKSEELFVRVINGINDGVFDYNVADNLVTYSPSYKVIWGYGEEELTRNHDNFYNFVHPDDLEQAQETMRQYLARETSTYYNVFRVRHKDGHWVWVMSRGVGIWNEKGEIQRLIGTHVDISQQKQREEELKYFIQENELQRKELAAAKERAESAGQAKSDFLATISHEIRTPMNAVIGLSRLLLGTPLDTKQHNMVETLHINADVLLRLVNDLLDLSRIESGQLELEERSFTVSGLFKALQTMLGTQATAKGLELSMSNDLSEDGYLGDPNRIQQILTNLIGNAIKFTPKGIIKVTAQGKIVGDKADVLITVADTGVGIPEDKLSLVFEKFVQADQTISRRFGGSGLGLAICKSLAQMMGGDIGVESATGKGSSFTVSLPLKVAPVKPVLASPTKVAAATAVSSNGTLLLVEDYAPNIMVATMMLEHLGYEADVAKSGTEALQKLKVGATPYIAILMDVQMQDMDGFETTRRIRAWEKERGQTHFIIGVTAHALAGDRDNCIEAGMDDYMSKPIHPDILAQKLQALKKAA